MTNTTTPTLIPTNADPKVESILRVYDAFSRGDVDAVLAEVADDVDWAADAASMSAPWFGPHDGKAEVPRFLEELGSSVEISEFTPLSVTSNDTDVMVVIRWTCTARSTGRSATMDLYHWWRFAEGKIVLYRGCEDTEVTAALFR